MVKVSKSPTGVGRGSRRPANKEDVPSTSRSSRALPTSTLLTSPLSPSSRRQNNQARNNLVVGDSESEDYGFNENAFSHVSNPKLARPQSRPLGPPITTDDRMEDLPEVHRFCIADFVQKAKAEDEKLRNKNGHRKPYFTDNNFRDMAIQWTATEKAMLAIPGIDQVKVKLYGKKFIPLVKKAHESYTQMNPNHNQDMDQNHRIVIDLVDDDEETDEDEYDDDNMSQTEEHSQYFVPPDVQEFNRAMNQASSRDQSRPPARMDPPAQNVYKGNTTIRSRGGRGDKRGPRNSAGSTSSRSYAAGVSKRGGSRTRNRKTSATSSRKSGGSKTTSDNSSMINQFAYNNKRGGGSGGGGLGGIGMMPT